MVWYRTAKERLLALIFVGTLAGCSSCFRAHLPLEAGAALPRIVHYDTRELRHIVVPGRIVFLLAKTHADAQRDTLEDAACLYGYLAGDSLVVDSVLPARVTKREQHSVTFGGAPGRQGCGSARYLGGVHTHLITRHNAQPTIGPSGRDFTTYWADSRAIIMVLSYDAETRPNDERILHVFWIMRDGRWGSSRWSSLGSR